MEDPSTTRISCIFVRRTHSFDSKPTINLKMKVFFNFIEWLSANISREGIMEEIIPPTKWFFRFNKMLNFFSANFFSSLAIYFSFFENTTWYYIKIDYNLKSYIRIKKEGINSNIFFYNTYVIFNYRCALSII